jgi:hypothetical protein
MFCPSCRAEFREGFTECSDCGETLVAELPPESGREEIVAGLTAVFTTGSSDELGRIVDRLEKAGVAYVIEAGTAMALLDGRDDDVPHEWYARLSVVTEYADRAARIVEHERQRSLSEQ